MWVAKIKFDGENTILGSRCKKFKVAGSGYPISTHIEGDVISVYAAYFIFASDKKINEFINDLKKDKRVVHIEKTGNFILCQIHEDIKYKAAYKQSIIHLEPVIANADGAQLWTVGSWNKNELMEFLDIVETHQNGQLLSIKKQKVDTFSLISMNPSLTDSQRMCLEFATEKGYYNYPRKVDVKKLAELKKISYTTFHEHLRKAEQKMMPFTIGKAKDLISRRLP